MKRSTRKYLEDVLFSIERIESSAEGLTGLEFKYNIEKQDAILMRLMIIGEAASNLPKELKGKYPGIKWRDITEMRNIVVHEYFGIDTDRTWLVVNHDLPVLKKEMIKMLKELGTR